MSLLSLRSPAPLLCALILIAAPACGSESAGDDATTVADGSTLTGVESESGSASGPETGSGEVGEAGEAGEAGESAEASTTTSTTDSGDGDGDGDGGVSVCLNQCSTVSDCTSAAPAFDEDNYACEDGACRYLGCNSDEECAPSNLVCRQGSEGGISTCVVPCTTSTECSSGAPGAFDEDNYICVFGGCVYDGCNSDGECAQSIPGTVCAPIEGVDFSSCQYTCTTPADCSNGQPGFGEANYACETGICRYTGCNSSAECGAGLVCP